MKCVTTQVSLLLILSTITAYAQTAEAHPGAKCLLASAKQLLSRTDSALRIIELLEAANARFATTAPDDPAFAEALEMWVMFHRWSEKDNPAQWRCDAAPLVQHALKIREARSSVEPDDLALALELQADMLGRTGAGAICWQRANKIRMAHVASVPSEVKQSLLAINFPPGNYDVPPTIAKKVEPEYSVLAKHAGLECFGVLLQISIDIAGVPGEFRLKQGCGYGLDEKAVEAVKQWRFHPALRNGDPVASPAQVEVNFKLIP